MDDHQADLFGAAPRPAPPKPRSGRKPSPALDRATRQLAAELRTDDAQQP